MSRTKTKRSKEVPQVPQSICDACSKMISAEDAQSCERCDGTFCDEHIGDLDHECTDEEDQ